MGLTRTDIERIQQEAGEEGTPDISYETIKEKDGEGNMIDYTGLDIHHTLARYTIWQDLDLTRFQAPHASLLGTKFAYSRLEHAYFGWADMRNASIQNCWMPDTSLLQATLDGARISDTMLHHTTLGASQMNRVHMQFCKAVEAVFAGAQCREMSLLTCNLQRADFQHTNLTDAVFADCDLTGANLSHANLTGTVFTDCTLEAVDLAYADLTGVCITLDQLRYANLLHIRQAFADICAMRSHETLMAYRDEVFGRGKLYSLPEYLGIALVPNSAPHCVEQFTHGLIPKKNEAGEVDARYSDVPVRMILLEWIENWLDQ